MKEKNYIHKKHPNVTTAMQQTILNFKPPKRLNPDSEANQKHALM